MKNYFYFNFIFYFLKFPKKNQKKIYKNNNLFIKNLFYNNLLFKFRKITLDFLILI